MDPALLMTASGAAFAAVVIGQMATAFACRSATTPPWKQGWFTNRLLLWAVAAEFLALAVFLFLPPLAGILGQAPPTLAGWLIAILAFPAVLGVDLLYKSLKHPAERSIWMHAIRP